MRVWSWIAISVLLLAASAGLIFSHVRAWRRVQGQGEDLDEEEIRFRRGQYRRRMQTSAMLGILAVGLFVGYWIKTPTVSPTVFAVYWSVVLLLVLWVGLLAVADIVSTKFHYGRLREQYVVQEAKLRSELRRIERVRSNGQKEPDVTHRQQNEQVDDVE